METNLVIESAKFMALGMGTVFLFLVTLIFIMNIMSYLIHKFFPDKNLNNTQENQTDKKRVVAAISAAIMHHREGKL